MNLKQILHLLAEGISLTQPVRDDLHKAIEALAADGSAPEPAPEPELTPEQQRIAWLQAELAKLQGDQAAQAAG